MPFLTGGNVFLGDGAADDLVLDRRCPCRVRCGIDVDDDVAVLAAAARLLDELAFALASAW